MNNIFEKTAVTAKLSKIFDIYFFRYLATNEKISITCLLYAMELQTMYHLKAKNKIANNIFYENTLTARLLELQRLHSMVRISKYLLLRYPMWNRSETLPWDSLPKTR